MEMHSVEPARSGPRASRNKTCCLLLCLVALPLAFIRTARAQSPSARQLVQQVIDKELAENLNNHSHWIFRDADITPGKNTVKLVVQTKDATVSRTIELNGRSLTPQQQAQDREKMQSVLKDPSVRARQKKSSAHDDRQAVSMMRMLPDAFLWTYTGETNGEITLHFQPNPAFQPPTYASRVFAAMAGTMVVDAKQKRLKILSGTLIQPVEFGWGLLGKLEKGGTFRVERSEIAPGDWEITGTHVHIHGRALLFKSISEQEDETTSNYKPAPPSLTLSQAIEMLNNGTIAEELGIQPQ